MAEALLNKLGKGRFRAFSAGLHPVGHVHPLAVERLDMEEVPHADARSKGWQEFSGADAPVLDFVITVCDQAAKETCPTWAGQPIVAHWGVPDPTEVSAQEQHIAFAKAFAILERRIALFTSLPISSLERLALQNKVQDIGNSA
jgi:arsenate reductase (thioredoxin)